MKPYMWKQAFLIYLNTKIELVVKTIKAPLVTIFGVYFSKHVKIYILTILEISLISFEKKKQ